MISILYRIHEAPPHKFLNLKILYALHWRKWRRERAMQRRMENEKEKLREGGVIMLAHFLLTLAFRICRFACQGSGIIRVITLSCITNNERPKA